MVLTGAAAGQTMYLDGAKVGFQTGAVKPETVVQAYLGAGYSSPEWDGQPRGVRYFSGQLDKAAFYNKELNAATVADHYKARTRLVTGSADQYQSTVMADTPAGYWQLDETTKAKLGTPGAFGPGERTAAHSPATATATPSSPAPRFPTPISRSNSGSRPPNPESPQRSEQADTGPGIQLRARALRRIRQQAPRPVLHTGSH